jgi:DHA1 family bicyclomycin/chloramphenicol resistance-like MFS transporter
MTASRSQGVPGWLIVIGVMTGIGPISIDLYLPAFSMIEADFGAGGVETTMASYLLGVSLGQLLYGPLSDYFGRKPPLYFGFALYTVGSLGCALSTDMTMLIVCRVIQALGGCSGMTIGRAIVRDRCQPEQAARAFSTLMTIVSVAPILAPILGGVIVTHLGWRAAFYFQAALGVAILYGIHHALEESLAEKRSSPLNLGGVLATYARLITHRTFMGYSLITAFAWAALFCYVSGAPKVLPQMYGVSPQMLGWLIGVNGLAFMIASHVNLRSLRRRSPQHILSRAVWAPAIFATLLLLAGVASVYWTLMPLAVVIALQFAFFATTARISPNVSALALAPFSQNAGSASAVMGAVQSLTGMIAGLAIAAFTNGTLVPIGVIMTVSMLSCCALYLWVRKATR